VLSGAQIDAPELLAMSAFNPHGRSHTGLVQQMVEDVPVGPWGKRLREGDQAAAALLKKSMSSGTTILVVGEAWADGHDRSAIVNELVEPCHYRVGCV